MAQLIPFSKKLKQLWVSDVSHTGRTKLEAAARNMQRESSRDFQLFIW